MSTPQEIYIYSGVRVYKLQGREYMAGVHVNYIPSEKDVFFVLSQVQDREKIPSPHEESTLSPFDSML